MSEGRRQGGGGGGDSGGFSVSEILQAAERAGEEVEGHDFFHTSQANTPLLRNEEEPSVMRQAAEFSHFEPDHLTSIMNRDSLLRSTRIPPTTGQESVGIPPSSSSSLQLSATAASLPRSLGQPPPQQPSTTAVPTPPSSTFLPLTADRAASLRGSLSLPQHGRPLAEGFAERGGGHSRTSAVSGASSLPSLPSQRPGSKVVEHRKPPPQEVREERVEGRLSSRGGGAEQKVGGKVQREGGGGAGRGGEGGEEQGKEEEAEEEGGEGGDSSSSEDQTSDHSAGGDSHEVSCWSSS